MLLSEVDLSAGDVMYPPGGTLGPRRQRHLQLVLVHAGSAAIAVDGVRRAALTTGMVGLLLPGHREAFAFAADTPTRHAWIEGAPAGAPLARLAGLPPALTASTALTELVSATVAAARTPLPTARPLLAALGSAIDLLAHTGLPVGEIADRTGFKSVYHFSRRVRQATGMPPTQLRRERWAGR